MARLHTSDKNSEQTPKENGTEITNGECEKIKPTRMQYIHFLAATGLKELKYSVGVYGKVIDLTTV